jgi:hypothetical protein
MRALLGEERLAGDEEELAAPVGGEEGRLGSSGWLEMRRGLRSSTALGAGSRRGGTTMTAQARRSDSGEALRSSCGPTGMTAPKRRPAKVAWTGKGRHPRDKAGQARRKASGYKRPNYYH